MINLPIVAAIVNYNMAQDLYRLLGQVTKQDYDAVFVLDDASTDNSREIVKKYPNNVTLVAGKTNKGAGANRNRIMQALDYDAIIHFLDADVILQTDQVVKVIRTIVPDQPFGFIGGLITNKNGLQSVWNYGSGTSLRSGIAAQMQANLIEPKLTTQPERAKRLRRRFENLLADWPDPLATPTRRPVYWAAEANFIVRSDIFKQFGGFDESIREIEALELAWRMQQQKLPRYFDPRIAVQHAAAQVRPYNRNLKKAGELAKLSRKISFMKWLTSSGKAN